MEGVPELGIELPRIGIVGSAEGNAVIQKEAPVRQIQGGGGQGEARS